MEYKDAFSSYHPMVNFVYFGLVFSFSMCLMHPICLLISCGTAYAYHFYLYKGKSIVFLVQVALPVSLMTAIINPAFNHQGKVILCYLPTGNPLTLESIIYGLAAAMMLVTVLLWFGCYSAIMTSDKFVYLFGRIIPALSLVLSMGLGFFPRFVKQFNKIKEAQAGIGRDVSQGSLWHRARIAFSCFSIMVSWALENAIETADSMKSRGYGLKGRTAFSIYRMTDRDKGALVWLGFCGVYLLCGSLAGGLFWRYFPSIRGVLVERFTISIQLVYFALCCTPMIINKREDRKWISSRLNI